MSDNRPLSPHLQIYQPQLTWLLSITHRFTGVALVFGLLMFSWWIIAVASGPGPYRVMQDFVLSWLGQMILMGWTVALWFHMLNGIRHLVWDAGYGLSLKAVYRSGWAVVAGTAVMTVITLVAAYTAIIP
ncbi:MAG: succinate dehydrogenase, cytochrome b556 subunit [Pseudomonadota bacterium]|nr:succinate dehydrogenase, cytochrome b556 subunit [Pseudomonadota bacterium]